MRTPALPVSAAAAGLTSRNAIGPSAARDALAARSPRGIIGTPRRIARTHRFSDDTLTLWSRPNARCVSPDEVHSSTSRFRSATVVATLTMVSLSIDALYPPSSIPGRWGPPGVYARLLRASLDAVWAVHGEAMAEALGDRPRHRWNEVLPDEDLDTDDIPF